MVVVSDGVGRISGLEFLQRKYQKTGDAGVSPEASVAYELFRGERGRTMTLAARLEAMTKIGYRNWSREAEE